MAARRKTPCSSTHNHKMYALSPRLKAPTATPPSVPPPRPSSYFALLMQSACMWKLLQKLCLPKANTHTHTHSLSLPYTHTHTFSLTQTAPSGAAARTTTTTIVLLPNSRFNGCADVYMNGFCVYIITSKWSTL